MSDFHKKLFRKCRFVVLAALGLSLLASHAVNSEAAEIVAEGPAVLYVAEESVGLSSGPGDDYPILSSVSYGTPIHVDAMTDNAWYRVDTGDGLVWIDGEDCSVEDPMILTEGCRIVAGPGIEPSSIAAVKEKFDLIPESLKPLFSGIDVYLDRERMRENYVGKNDVNILAGIYVYGKEIDLDEDYVKSSIIHECGHHIDYTIGDKFKIGKTFGVYEGVYMLSYTDEFQDIFYLEAGPSGLIDYHPNKVPAEYFASAFEKYVENPAGLMQCAPLTYMYMCRLAGTN